MLSHTSDRFELALTVTFALQVNRLTKCATHPKHSSRKADLLFTMTVLLQNLKKSSSVNTFLISRILITH